VVFHKHQPVALAKRNVHVNQLGTATRNVKRNIGRVIGQSVNV